MADSLIHRNDCSFAANLRAELARKAISQSELAETLGCTQTAISYYATGRREPSLDRLCHIADVLGVTTDYLLGRKGC